MKPKLRKASFVLFGLANLCSACEDVDIDFEIISIQDIFGPTMRSCRWVEEADTADKCQLLEVIAACPSTCGLCDKVYLSECEDSTGRFRINGEPAVKGRKKCA